MLVPQSIMIRVVAQLLNMSATEFQFPLADVVPDVQLRRYLIAAVHEAFPHALGEFDPSRTYETWSAWHLARFAAIVCDREAETFDALELCAKNGIKFEPLALASTESRTDGELLAYLGTDAERWARSCIEHAHRADKVDESFLLGWFANAIEAGKASRGNAIETHVEGVAQVMRTELAANVPPFVMPSGEATFDGREWTFPPATPEQFDKDVIKAFEKAEATKREGFERQLGSGEDGLENDEEFRTRIKAELDAKHGVGPGTEFPNLTAEPIVATAPDGTVTEGVGIAHVEISAPEVGRVRESYANQAMVESVLGQPDGELRDASGNLVGGMFLSPASKLREIVAEVIEKLQAERGKLTMTRQTFDEIEVHVEAEGTFPIVAVEMYDDPTPGAFPSLKVTTMSGGREISVVVP